MATELGKMCNIVEVLFLQNLMATARTSYVDFGFVATANENCNSDSLRDHKLYTVYKMVFERQ